MCFIVFLSFIFCLLIVFFFRISLFLRVDIFLFRLVSCYFNCVIFDLCFCCVNLRFKEFDCSCIMFCFCWLSFDCSFDLIFNKIVSIYIFIKLMINC